MYLKIYIYFRDGGSTYSVIGYFVALGFSRFVDMCQYVKFVRHLGGFYITLNTFIINT